MSPLTMPSVLAFGLAVLGMSVSAFAQESGENDDRRTLTVSGRGEISAAPDVAEISIGVVREAPSAGEALRANSEAMAALQEELRNRGVAARDIQTVDISLNPKYSQPPRQVDPAGFDPNEPFVPRIVGYEVHNSVRITARDLSKLGETLDAVVGAGANQMNGISFRVDEPSKLLDEARKRAMADAKRKAELLCGEAGLVLGSPVQITESPGIIPPPIPMGRMAMMAAESAVPVAPGEQDLSVSVQVVFEMKLPD